jgi:hypothetical protein
MFGLTKREQRWKAEQRAAELLVGLAQSTVRAAADVRVAEANAERTADARDAARYRWLRQQHWNEAPLCVVMQPRQAVKLGHDCPAMDRLDAVIDQAMTTDGVAASLQAKALNDPPEVIAAEFDRMVDRAAGVEAPDGGQPK